MGLTDEQIQANRKSASNVIKIQLNLDQTANSDWTYDQRTQYDKALAAYILAHPAAFASQDIQTAQKVKSTDYSPLDDTDFSYSDFGNEVVNNVVDAGTKVASIGTGVLNTANLVGKILPFVAIAGGLFLAYVFFTSQAAKIKAI